MDRKMKEKFILTLDNKREATITYEVCIIKGIPRYAKLRYLLFDNGRICSVNRRNGQEEIFPCGSIYDNIDEWIDFTNVVSVD